MGTLAESGVPGLVVTVMLLSAAVAVGYYLLLYKNHIGLYVILIANILGVLMNRLNVPNYSISVTTGLIPGIITYFVTRKQVAYPFGRPPATERKLSRLDDPNAAPPLLPAEMSPSVEATPASSSDLAQAETPWPPSDAQPGSVALPAYTPSAYPPPAETSRLAIASLATGIATWLVLPLVGAVVAVVTGHLAKKQIRRTLSG